LRVGQIDLKFKHLFEFFLRFVRGVRYKYPIEQTFEQGVKTMSAIALQYPSLPRLGRRGRLARFLVVLSLTVVLGAGFAMRAGAGVSIHHTPKSYVSMVVAPGETLWSIASTAAGSGDVRAMVDEIISINSLSTPDVSAGQSLRVPA
jgi:hypothetical protein